MRVVTVAIQVVLFLLVPAEPFVAQEPASAEFLLKAFETGDAEEAPNPRLDLSPYLLASSFDGNVTVEQFSRDVDEAFRAVFAVSESDARPGTGHSGLSLVSFANGAEDDQASRVRGADESEDDALKTSPLGEAESERNWEIILAPYVLFINIEGDAGIGRATVSDVDVDFSDILEVLKIGAMGRLEARVGRWGLFLDGAYMKLHDDISGPRGLVGGAEIEQFVLESFLFYRFELKRGWIDAFVGARYWYIDLDVELTASADRERSETEEWVDPVLGARISHDIAERWYVTFRGDVGGFGVSSDFSWNVQGAIHWELSDWFGIAVGYRALGVDYDDGHRNTRDFFAYDTISHGPFLGFLFKI